MTLLNIVRQSDRVHLATDGAALREDDATVCGLVSKCMVFPHLNCAIGFRGQYQIGSIMMSSFGSAESFDDLQVSFSSTVRKQLKAIRAPWESMLGPTACNFDLAVAGWSSRADMPIGFFMSTVRRAGTPAFKMIETDHFITPSTDALYREVQPILEKFDAAARDMTTIVEKQRTIREPIGPNNIQTSYVGGFLQLTTIFKSHITSRIVHRWPDVIGKRIQPAARS